MRLNNLSAGMTPEDRYALALRAVAPAENKRARAIWGQPARSFGQSHADLVRDADHVHAEKLRRVEAVVDREMLAVEVAARVGLPPKAAYAALDELHRASRVTKRRGDRAWIWGPTTERQSRGQE